MITDGDIFGDVSTVLDDGVVADLNLFVTNDCGSVPDGSLLTGRYVSNDCGVGGDKIGLFELGFVILKGEISQTGDHSVFGAQFG